MGDIETMKMLKFKGAHVDAGGRMPLITASKFGQVEAAKWLVDHGANVAAAALVPGCQGN